MGDLISRSALIETLTKYRFGAISNDTEKEYIKETVLNFVKEQPTAYSIENVVAELEEESAMDDIDFTYYIRKSKAIDIVKRGGVDD